MVDHPFVRWALERGPGILANVLYALVIFGAGWIAARITGRIVEKAFERSTLKDNVLLKRLGTRAVRITILVVAGIIAVERLGMNAGPFIAGLGASGLILGFAFKDTLSNFAEGILILVYQPFRAGDVVDIGGTMGIVEDLTFVNTKLKAFDGPAIFLPNTQVWGSKIINYSHAPFRRPIFTVGVSYGDDLKKAWDAIEGVVKGDERILEDPAPFLRIAELGDSGVDFQVFAYVAPENMGPLMNDFYGKLKGALEAAGCSIPYPQRDVRLLEGSAAPSV